MIKTIKKVAVIIMTVVIMISTVTIADQASSTTVQETKCRNKSYSIINKWKLEKN